MLSEFINRFVGTNGAPRNQTPQTPSAPPPSPPPPPPPPPPITTPRETLAARAGIDTAAQRRAQLEAQLAPPPNVYHGGEATVTFGASDTPQTVARRSLEMFAAQAGLPPPEQARFADAWSNNGGLTLKKFETTGAREWTANETSQARNVGFTVLTLDEKNQANIVADLQRRQQALNATSLTPQETQVQARLERVNIAQQKAAEVWANLPADQRQGDALGKFLEQNHAALSRPAFAQYMELRGDTARELSGATLNNEIGIALNIPPNNAPATPAQQAAFNNGTHEFYTGDARQAISTVADSVRAVGGDNARVTVLPVTLSSKETGLIQVPLFRVEGANGQGQFIDHTGRRYSSLQDWRDNNTLPPGTLSYPTGSRLTSDGNGQAAITTEASHAVPDTFWEKAQPWVDGAVTVGGVAAGIVVLVGSGGTAAPFLLAGASLYGAGRAGGTLYDRATHGQTLSPTDGQARMAWLELGASALGAGSIGATLRATTLTARGVSSAATMARTATALNIAGQYADTGAAVNQTLTLAANWETLTPQQRMQQVGQIAFWGGMTGVQARQSGGIRNLYGAQGIGEQLTAMRQGLQRLDPRAYEIRQMQTPDGQTFNVVVRKEPLEAQAMQMSNANPTSGGGSSSYNATTRTDAQLQTDLDPTLRSGETQAQADARIQMARSETEVREAQRIYEALGSSPPRINILTHDAQNRALGAHTVDRHGAQIPLSRNQTVSGNPTVEGRIYGDSPWSGQTNFSYKWTDDSTMNRTINEYLTTNWERVRSDLALNKTHEANFDAGHAVGEGYFNSGQMGIGNRDSVYHRTSQVKITIDLQPGNPPSFVIIRAYPNGSGR